MQTRHALIDTNANVSGTMRRRNSISRATSSRSLSELVPQFLNYCELEHRKHPATVKRLSSSLTSLMNAFGLQFLNAMTPLHLERFKAMRYAQGLTAVSVRHDLHAISKFFKWAIRHGHASANPVSEISIPSDREAVRVKVLTAEEEERYFQELSRYIENGQGAPFAASNGDCESAFDQCRVQNLHDLGRLMLCLGARPSELLGLSLQDVNLPAGRICIAAGKSRAACRTLALNEEAAEIVARRLQGGRGSLFPGAKLVSLDRLHRAVLEAAGMAHWPIYTLRHTFASRLAESGCPPTVLASILGHANLSCILKYCHTGIDAMTAWLKGGKVGAR